jgi:hypothetical protein
MSFILGVQEAMEKVAKSNLHPRSIAGFVGEGGRISKSLAAKFKISPGEINKAKKVARKSSRKASVKKEITRRTASGSFFSKLPGTKVTGHSAVKGAGGAATKVTQHSAVKGTGAAAALGL